jgi:hypothetical protein
MQAEKEPSRTSSETDADRAQEDVQVHNDGDGNGLVQGAGGESDSDQQQGHCVRVRRAYGQVKAGSHTWDHEAAHGQPNKGLNARCSGLYKRKWSTVNAFGCRRRHSLLGLGVESSRFFLNNAIPRSFHRKKALT